MAERKGLALRRVLRSAEPRNDSAMARGLRSLKTFGSRSSALLVSVTLCDQSRAESSRRLTEAYDALGACS